MTELYRIVGPTIRDQLEGLRPAQMEQVEAAFAEADGDMPIQKKPTQKPKETIVTNIDHAKKGKGPQNR